MIFPKLKSVLSREGRNEVAKVSLRGRLGRAALALASGVLMSCAFPPLNWGFAAFLALTPLIYLCLRRNTLAAGGFGYLWGLGWSLPSFWWLREIDPAVPFALAPVLALWSALFCAPLPFLFRGICIPDEVRLEGYEAERGWTRISFARQFFFAVAISGWWLAVDYLRVGMFPWNYLGVSQYKNILLLQIAEYSGVWGISWLIVLVNAALALALTLIPGALRAGRRPEARVFLAALVLLSGALLLGIRLRTGSWTHEQLMPLAVGAVQGDISQRRNADSAGAREALDIYTEMTRKLLRDTPRKPDLIVWPETAVPYPLYGATGVSARYRADLYELLNRGKTSMLIGTLDFRSRPDGEIGLTNSALLFDVEAGLRGRYDKIHRVPFGEFIPFRRRLPQWFVRLIDMQRDLVPGTDPTPFKISANSRAGIAICYESVFASLARREAQRGANLLLVISNDAWYPRSSEPEQHLANAVIRSIETRLPSLRCGNNGGTLVVSPDGTISQPLTGITGRGRAAGVLNIAPRDGAPTFYVRYGDVFLGLAALLAFLGFGFAARRFYAEAKVRRNFFRENATGEKKIGHAPDNKD